MRNKMNAWERKMSAQEVVNNVMFHMQTWNSALQGSTAKVRKDNQPK
jgi:hypothetical protein